MDLIQEIIEFIGKLVIAVLAVLAFPIAIFIILSMFFLVLLGFNAVEYYFDKSECNIFVDNEVVYSGKCHFADVVSVGENGNSKHVVIYKDIFKTQPIKHYISEKVEVKQ